MYADDVMPVTDRPARVLSIAGSDPSGGAGIQADLKTFSALGCYGMAAPTALTAQNTLGVRAVHVPPPAFLRAQLDAIADDVPPDAVKIGMLATAEVAGEVAAWLRRARPPHVVLDPVMVATSGDRLLDTGAVAALRELLPLADVVTPNLPELADLLGVAEPAGWDAALALAARLVAAGAARVLVKGGHLRDAPDSRDALVDADGVVELPGRRIRTRNTHGTGCTLSSALAALRTRHPGWTPAARAAKEYLSGALEQADRLAVGAGNGPVHHFHRLWAAGELTGPAGAGAAGHDGPGEHRAGPVFTTQVWRRIEPIRRAIDGLPFLRALAEGTLDERRFGWYLRQDARYLSRFARALARCAQLAGPAAEQVLFAEASRDALVVERALHEDWLGGRGLPPAVRDAPVTAAYTDHLDAVSATGGYPELVAAVLPCFWIYADVGARLHVSTVDVHTHPYRAWLDTYADEEFAAVTGRVKAVADRLAAGSGAETRQRMMAAFERSAEYEWAFWDAAWDCAGWPLATATG